MAQYANLKDSIAEVIKANGNNEITGTVMQNALLTMISTLGAYYQYVGIASTSTNPGTPDQNVFYLAKPGTYPTFGNQTIPNNSLGVLYYNGTWQASSIGIYDIAPSLTGLLSGYTFMYTIGTAPAQLKQAANFLASTQTNVYYIATIPGNNLVLQSDDGTINYTFSVENTAIFILCQVNSSGKTISFVDSGIAIFNPLQSLFAQTEQLLQESQEVLEQVQAIISSSELKIDLVSDTAKDIWDMVTGHIEENAHFLGINGSNYYNLTASVTSTTVDLYYYDNNQYLRNIHVTKNGTQYSMITNYAEYTVN
jgi:hypothetical protein